MELKFVLAGYCLIDGERRYCNHDVVSTINNPFNLRKEVIEKIEGFISMVWGGYPHHELAKIKGKINMEKCFDNYNREGIIEVNVPTGKLLVNFKIR